MSAWDPENDDPFGTGWPDIPITEPTLGPDGYGRYSPGQSRPASGPIPLPGGYPGTPIYEPLQGGWNLPTAGSGGLASALTKLGLSASDLAKLGIAGAVGIGGAVGGGDDDMPPELRQLLELQRQRYAASNPLYESVLRLAFSRLPTHATQGLSIPPVGGLPGGGQR